MAGSFIKNEIIKTHFCLRTYLKHKYNEMVKLAYNSQYHGNYIRIMGFEIIYTNHTNLDLSLLHACIQFYLCVCVCVWARPQIVAACIDNKTLLKLFLFKY